MWVILENCGTDIMQMSACADITHTLDTLCIKKDGREKNTLIVKQTELIAQHWHWCHLWLALAQILHQGAEDDLRAHDTLEGADVSRWGIRRVSFGYDEYHILARMHRLVAHCYSPDKKLFCSPSLMKQFSWWRQPHAEKDLSGGLHCIGSLSAFKRLLLWFTH